MPQAVSEYLEARDFGRVDAVKRDILSLYRNDIAKFGGADATRIARVFSTLPGQLAKHDRKFRLVSLDANARGRDYADAFFWLSDAFITSTCLNATGPVGRPRRDGGRVVLQVLHGRHRPARLAPLRRQRGDAARGVPRHPPREARDQRGDVHRERRRPAARVQRARPVLLSRRDDRDWSNTMEVDFLVTRGYDDAAGRMRVSPVEVKSTKRYGARFARQVQGQVGSRVGTRYILHPRPMEVSGDLVRAAALRLHGAVGRVWHRLPRRPVEGRGPGRRPGAPASIPDSGVKKARLADRHKRARAPRPHNLGSDARKNKVIR